jgi:hypothetical protein
MLAAASARGNLFIVPFMSLGSNGKVHSLSKDLQAWPSLTSLALVDDLHGKMHPVGHPDTALQGLLRGATAFYQL